MKTKLSIGASAYISVILIWSTTPFAIQMSNDSLGPYAAILVRISLATMIAGCLLKVWLKQSAFKRQYLDFYLAAGFAIFPNMALVYMAAQYIPSGLISVLFASVPFYIGFIRALVLKQNTFNKAQLIALCIAVFAMYLIFRDQIQFNSEAKFGLLLMMLSNLCFAISNVSLKHLNDTREVQPSAFVTTFGSMLVALPGLFITWLIMDGSAMHFSQKSLSGSLYLATIGSIIGFAAYYMSVRKMSITAMAVLPLISPVLALWIGASFNNETITGDLSAGSLLILIALLMYEGSLIRQLKQQWLKRKMA